MKHYPQLTYEQRCQIYVLKKSGFSQRAIAKSINVNQSTVSRELSRNTGKNGYRYKQAQALAANRRKSACKPTKMTADMIKLIESKLRIEWSPEQISGWLLTEQRKLISHETIYLHIWSDKRKGGDLYTYLRRKGKKYDKRRNGKSTRGTIPDRVSIDERPPIVDEKARVGDWEIDTVIGKGHRGALVTIVERVTNFTVSKQVDNKTAEVVTETTIELLQPLKEVVHTITADNGKEFTQHKVISAVLEADVYFAHPYCSCERGLNENTNGLLRQYFPKCTDFTEVTQLDVKRAVNRLNSRPRKSLGFKTPNDLMAKHRAAIAA